MLHFEKVMPTGVADGAPMLVLLHGRGSDEKDLLRLGEELLPGVMVVSPRAPFPGAPWGYGAGWAWYRFLGGDRPDPDSFERSVEAIGELLSGLPELLPVRPGPVVLGGFSQGGTMSLAYAVQNPDMVAGVINFSGFLAAHPAVERSLELRPRVRVFWGHGTGDPAIPHALAVAGRARLASAEIEMVARDYEIGHWIAPEELEDAGSWVRDLVASHEGARGGEHNQKR